MSLGDDLLIREPHAYRGITGKVVITCAEGIVHPGGGGDFYWQHGLLKWVIPPEKEFHYLGEYNGDQVFSVELSEQEFAPLSPQVSGLRALLGELPEGLFRLLGRALQINEWYRAHSYCGYCGGRTYLVENERAMGCAECERIFYPRLAPCVMALVTRGDYCLLARNGQWRRSFYSVLAGFIEPGESAEDALRREVKEEVGLEVGELHYKGSQPWPFPGQLMLGFFADYGGGDIAVDGVEIAEANWYHYRDLPPVPAEYSLSGQLIRRFVAERESHCA